MEGTYPILLGGQPVGQAHVTRRGLYYHFSCQMKLTGETLCRLELSCSDKRENLGVPVPEGRVFVVTKTLPVSRCGSGKPEFRILPKHESVRGKFVPINPEEPFVYLRRLKHAYLQRRGEQLGIVIPDDGALNNS